MAGWLAVGAYEAYAILRKKETMSHAFYRALRTRYGAPALIVAWVMLSKHLFGYSESC